MQDQVPSLPIMQLSRGLKVFHVSLRTINTLQCVELVELSFNFHPYQSF